MEGIVIKTIDYKEKSKLVYLYTPFGMKSIKALDASKTKLGFITTLNCVEFESTAGKLPTLIEYSLKESYYSLYEDLKKVGVLSPILDIIQHLEEHVNHERIYSFFKQILCALRSTSDSYYILSLFLVKMLAVFGVKPVLKQCVRCSKEQNFINFSLEQGGALCEDCASSYNEKNLRILEDWSSLYYQKDFVCKPLRIPYKDLLDSIYMYYYLHINIRLKKYYL